MVGQGIRELWQVCPVPFRPHPHPHPHPHTHTHTRARTHAPHNRHCRFLALDPVWRCMTGLALYVSALALHVGESAVDVKI